MNRTDAQAFPQADLELAKWIALITMAVDHYGKIVDDSVFLETHAIGRISFPLFAAIIGMVAELVGLPAALAVPALLALFMAAAAGALRSPATS